MPGNEACIRFVTEPVEEGGTPMLTLYVNDTGQLLLLRILAQLNPANRHVHLAGVLTVAGELDITDCDVVWVDGSGDVTHAGPSSPNPPK